MSKGIDIGVQNLARKVIGGDIGVNDIARKILRAYIGDEDSKARLFYETRVNGEIYFDDTSAEISWIVPSGCTKIDIFCVGGGGGGGGMRSTITHYDTSSQEGFDQDVSYGSCGGSGYTATALNVSVTPGENLKIKVGAGGTRGLNCIVEDGVSTGDVSLPANETDGGDGGQSYVKRGSTSLAIANGGKGGIRNLGWDEYQPMYCNGVDGGNGSGCGGGFGESYRYSKSQQRVTQDNIRKYYQASPYDDSIFHGAHGTNGGNGGLVNGINYNAVTGQASYEYNRGVGGTGQGSNTCKYGNSSGEVFSTIGTEVRNGTGNSGKPGGAGSSGKVFIYVYYS